MKHLLSRMRNNNVSMRKREEEIECNRFPDTDDEEITTALYPHINLTSSDDKSINLPSIEEEPSEQEPSQDVLHSDISTVVKEPPEDSPSDNVMIKIKDNQDKKSPSDSNLHDSMSQSNQQKLSTIDNSIDPQQQFDSNLHTDTDADNHIPESKNQSNQTKPSNLDDPIELQQHPTTNLYKDNDDANKIKPAQKL